MSDAFINFEDFELPFSSKSLNIEDGEGFTPSKLKEFMDGHIPNEAIFIGSIDSEINNWISSIIKDDYYIIPLNDKEYNWALFRISWDDNWGTWNWSFDVRLIGFSGDFKEAAKVMLQKFWEKCELDLNDKSNQPYVDLLNAI